MSTSSTVSIHLGAGRIGASIEYGNLLCYSHMEKFIPYARQSISANDIEGVAASLNQDLITRGPLVETFEKEMASYCNAKYAVAFNTGTAALMAAYFAADMKSSDRLITTPNTFIATAGYPFEIGATPVFVDIDLDTGNANLDQLLWNAEPRTTRGRAFVAPVHFAGVALDMRLFQAKVANPDIVVIEDAAHAIGSSYEDGKKVGSCAYSDMCIFSFHPAKTMTTCEGGMVTTNDDKLWHRLKLFRNNGIERESPFISKPAATWYYEVRAITGNYNFTEMQAALGLSQLKRLDQFVDHRRALVKRYREKLHGMKHLKMMTDKSDDYTAYHLCVVKIDFAAVGKTRTQFMDELKAKGIGTQLHYIPLYEHPVFKNRMGNISEYFPNMETYYKSALSIPLFYDMTFEDVDRVVVTLQEALK